MAFVVPRNKAGHRALRKLLLSLDCAVTWLEGQGEGPVLAIPDPFLEEITERRIAVTVLTEAQVPAHLTPRGLAYYRHLRRHRPEYLYWNAPLPPALHVAMQCNVAPEQVETVRHIVERYQAIAFRGREVTVLAVTLEPDEPEEARALVEVEFMVPRVHQEAVMEALVASGAAGTSRATAICVKSDPDGPPRVGAGEETRG